LGSTDSLTESCPGRKLNLERSRQSNIVCVIMTQWLESSRSYHPPRFIEGLLLAPDKILALESRKGAAPFGV